MTINYEVDWRKVTYPHCDRCAEEVATPPRRCPFVGEEHVSWWEKFVYRVRCGVWPSGEWFQCDHYEGHWQFEGQREHRMPFFGRKWPVSAAEAARYNPSPSLSSLDEYEARLPK